jgi:hypothetical protein
MTAKRVLGCGGNAHNTAPVEGLGGRRGGIQVRAEGLDETVDNVSAQGPPKRGGWSLDLSADTVVGIGGGAGEYDQGEASTMAADDHRRRGGLPGTGKLKASNRSVADQWAYGTAEMGDNHIAVGGEECSRSVGGGRRHSNVQGALNDGPKQGVLARSREHGAAATRGAYEAGT